MPHPGALFFVGGITLLHVSAPKRGTRGPRRWRAKGIIFSLVDLLSPPPRDNPRVALVKAHPTHFSARAGVPAVGRTSVPRRRPMLTHLDRSIPTAQRAANGLARPFHRVFARAPRRAVGAARPRIVGIERCGEFPLLSRSRGDAARSISPHPAREPRELLHRDTQLSTARASWRDGVVARAAGGNARARARRVGGWSVGWRFRVGRDGGEHERASHSVDRSVPRRRRRRR